MNGCIRIAAGLLAAGVCTAGRADQNLVLARNGQAACTVVVPADAGPVLRHAADELALFLGRVTGAALVPAPVPAPGTYAVWLATPETGNVLARLGALEEVRALDSDGFLLQADTRGLLIAGNTPLGVLFGAYAFLEERVGLRWFYPGEAGTVCPRRPTLSIAAFRDRQNPVFKDRSVTLLGVTRNGNMIETWDWIVRNRMHIGLPSKHFPEAMAERGAGTYLGGHVLMNLVPDGLFGEHPEYFALLNGARVPQGERTLVQGVNGKMVGQTSHRSQPCTSNPDVIERAGRGIADLFVRPGVAAPALYHFLNNDCNGWCECARCRALDPPEERDRPGGSVSTRFYRFINEVAGRVWRGVPQADIWGYAYQNYRLPPTAAAPDPRLGLILCDHGRCYRHSLGDPACEPNAWFRGMFEGWARFPNRRNYYSYYTCFSEPAEGSVLAAPLEAVVAEDLCYMARLGNTSWDIIAYPPDGSYAHLEERGQDSRPRRDYWRANMHMHYLQAKLAWNPDADTAAIARDLNETFYGPAAGAMGRYRALLGRLWKETPGHFVYLYPYSLLGKSLMAPGAEREALALLDEAERAVADEPVYQRRVAEDRDLFARSWLAMRAEYAKRPSGEIAVPRLQDAITLDGRLDEPAWKACDRVAGFVRRQSGGQLADCQTYVRLLYDDDCLYAGLEMEGPPGSRPLMRAKQRDDDRIFKDDTIELFVDPDGEGAAYVHLALNPAGVVRDSRRTLSMTRAGDPGFDTDVRAAVGLGDGQWTVELSVSARSLGGAIRDHGRWTMDVVRVRTAGDQPSEISSWMDGAVHNPDSFRRIVFARPLLRNGGFEDSVTLVSEAQRNRAKGWTYGNSPAQRPSFWSLNIAAPGTVTVLTNEPHAGRAAVEIQDGFMYQMLDGDLSAGMNLTLGLAARGAGTLEVAVYRYGADGKGRGSVELGAFDLEPEWRLHELTYAHPPGASPRAALAFRAKGRAALDAVRVEPAD